MTKTYKIGGITVDFPYTAYGPQLAYMSKIVSTLEQSRTRKDGRCNALLESPTGSGKSLALLCATLAWQQHYKGILSSKTTATREGEANADPGDEVVAGGGFIPEDRPTGFGPDDGDSSTTFQNVPKVSNRRSESTARAPKIFYTTRTHAQITQVIREFRKTKYRIPMAILAAKKHYCTNKKVQKKNNVDEDCLELLRGSPDQIQCGYFKHASRVKDHPSLQQGACKDIHDVEDVVNIGHSVRGCAYFAARAMAMEAEVVFCPYSYIVDPIIREAVEADIRGSIIIFDEAHNIEDVARDAGSVDLETGVLVDIQKELQALLQPSEIFEAPQSFYQPLLDMVQELIGWTEYQASHLTTVEFEHHSSCWTGDQAIAELRAAGLPLESFEMLLGFCRKAVTAASDDKVDHLSKRAVKFLERLFLVLQFMLQDRAERAVDYQLVVQKFMRRDKGPLAPGWVTSFSLWCLNPAVVFETISAVSRSIIVTSGTLAPVQSYASELGVLFDVRIEAPHVVDMETQVGAVALSMGPREEALNASYRNAENFLFQDAVGAVLLEIFKITPDGVLVFFPSYKLLQKLCDRWRSTGSWLTLANHKKLFIEPRGNDEIFESVLKGYHTAVNGVEPDDMNTFKKTKKNRDQWRGPKKTKKLSDDQFHAAPRNDSTNGAAFFAVCRGKVSEGIDFADKHARAVVVIGIPFPNVKDIRVRLKKQYNSTYQMSKNLLSGDQWYCQQAFRALNQAVGRCIRHRYDYGSIILLDERFKSTRYLEYMSKWLRHSIRQSFSFQQCMAFLEHFFDRLKDLDLQALNRASSPAVENLSSMQNGILRPTSQVAITSVKSESAALSCQAILGHNRASGPVIPVPITPLKSESTLLRVSQAPQDDRGRGESLANAFSLRSDLLDQFHATEHRPTPKSCIDSTSTQKHLCDNEVVGPEFLTQPQLTQLQDTPLSDVHSSAIQEKNDGYDLDNRIGNTQQWHHAIDEPDLGAPRDWEADITTVNIARDDGFYSSRNNLDHDKLKTFNSVCQPNAELSSEQCNLHAGLCNPRYLKISAIASALKHSSSPITVPGLLEAASSDKRHRTAAHIQTNDSPVDPASLPLISCCKCGLNFGTVCSAEIVILQKVYLTRLRNCNRPQQAFSVPTAVYLSNASVLERGLIEHPGAEFVASEIQAGACRRRQRGVWSEEDGCVFKSLVCSNCPDFYIGAQIMATDINNLALTGKVAIFVESIKCHPQGMTFHGLDIGNVQENECCQIDADAGLVPSPPKRPSAAPPGTGKLKLRRREKEGKHLNPTKSQERQFSESSRLNLTAKGEEFD